MCWDGPTYEDELERLKKDGVFPPCLTGLAEGAAYDLQQLVEYAFTRIGREKLGRRLANPIVVDINEKHVERRLEKYLKPWAQQETNLRFLQWLICQEIQHVMEPSATSAHVQADVIDYLTMELVGREFKALDYGPQA